MGGDLRTLPSSGVNELWEQANVEGKANHKKGQFLLYGDDKCIHVRVMTHVCICMSHTGKYEEKCNPSSEQ